MVKILQELLSTKNKNPQLMEKKRLETHWEVMRMSHQVKDKETNTHAEREQDTRRRFVRNRTNQSRRWRTAQMCRKYRFDVKRKRNREKSLPVSHFFQICVVEGFADRDSRKRYIPVCIVGVHVVDDWMVVVVLPKVVAEYVDQTKIGNDVKD